jgi:hypothetical protein
MNPISTIDENLITVVPIGSLSYLLGSTLIR